MKIFLLLLITLNSLNLFAQCNNNILNNGSFTSTKGEDAVAPGWTSAAFSPDINDEIGPLLTTPGYAWDGTPIASPSGGTWQNLHNTEAIKQTVQVIVGQQYDFCSNMLHKILFMLHHHHLLRD